MKTKLFGIALVAVTAAAVALYPAVHGAGKQVGAPQAGVQAAPRIEVVFVLDTTSSMTGLIQTAKEKIWSIASTMAQARQAPEIHMGLVAFRDRGDDYVTRVVDLSPDLDATYATLMRFQAQGGGDGPESVNEALAAAVDRVSWTQDPSSYKVIFLVGDAPPHMDYRGEAQYPEIVRAAAAKGIVVNTIQCGHLAQTASFWTEIARLGNGRYMQVEQSGGAFAVATPYDEGIAQLSAELDRTRLFYGSEEERAAMESKVAASAALAERVSAATRARRGVFSATPAGAASLFGDRDLVADVESGEVALEDVTPAHLPEPLRALDRAERKAVIDGLVERRAELRREIETLAEARSDFIDEKAAESPAVAGSLDQQIYETIREQAAERGLTYEKGPQF